VLNDDQAVAALYGRPNSGVAGFYRARASGALAFVHADRADHALDLSGRTVFFHEYLHHLMLQNTDLPLPGWIVEGAAELFATARNQADGSVMIGAAPTHRAYGLLAENSIPIEQMVGAANVKMTGAQRDGFYGRSWLLTHMLTFEPSRRGQLTSYVTGLQKGQTPINSAKAVFGDLKRLERELNSYVMRRRLAVFQVPASDLKVAAITMRPLSAAENAILPVVMRSDRGVRKDTAPRIAAQARQVAARFPADANVLAALAEAEQDAGNNATAIAAADRALTATPGMAKALVMKARAQLALARAQPAQANWSAIRDTIVRANKADTENAEPLQLFYESFLLQGVAPTRNAISGLIYAQQLAPQDQGLRMTAIHQLARDGKLAEARNLFAPMAYDPHAGETRERRLALLAALDKGERDKALELISAVEKVEGS
jgi:tetratricopeptide (TPR) repeat protein